ncbi:MAG: MarR family EPS-associated transcriptional regulator [Deltaproteobacteria bacterium]|nr:MarR family EPS-associated transcriptional regulator [Deltaproteobacteria bacterium]MBW2050187.1 MarR family EPS-associated transcriptional regulator [Deltaproteobacteria bacterium]
MNNHLDQEIRYRLLKLLCEERGLSQRAMAKRMGISLGKVNYCLSELAGRGLIKIQRFKNTKKKRPYAYVLTPRGLETKARLTITFLKRKIREYEHIREQIRELSAEAEQEAAFLPFDSGERDSLFALR